ncbi:hypothetical protein K1719_001934 [Acacia pycnantha]|nr:hypothetical protein K1719_001934 [Acacia pycnantha]
MKPFRRTLVVKLLGRQTSFGFMVKKLSQIWERKGKIDVFDMANDFYLINFQNKEDYMEALTGGPWVINDAYLSVARWRPEFSPKNAKIESVIAWVRLPDLPAPLFDKKFLLNLGNSIGKAIRLDIHTAQRAKGKFARMCVELNLTKPLVPEFNVDGQLLSVVYESLGQLCNKCGMVGHTKEGCESFHNKRNKDGMEVEEPKEAQGKEGRNGSEREVWKTVQRPRRQRSNAMAALNPQSGSRFSVLDTESGEGETLRGNGEVQEKGKEEEVPLKINLRPQWSQGRSTGIGETFKGVGSVKNRSMGRAEQARKREKDGRGKSGILTPKVVSDMSQRHDEQHSLKHGEGGTVTTREKRGGKVVIMNEKENMNPGDSMVGVMRKEYMDPGDITSRGSATSFERLGMCMEGGGVSTTFAR